MAFIVPMLATVGTALGASGAAAGMAGLAAVSGAVGAVGSIASGNAQAAAASYNAKINQQQAHLAADQGAAAALQQARQTRQTVAAAEAGAMEDGLSLTGSTNAVVNQARDTGNLNTLLAMYDGTLKAQGYRQNAALDRAQASASRTAGYFGAATSLLGGATNFYLMKQMTV